MDGVSAVSKVLGENKALLDAAVPADLVLLVLMLLKLVLEALPKPERVC